MSGHAHAEASSPAAELDYLVASRLGVSAELAVLRELAGGAWELPAFGAEEVAEAHAVVQRYAD